MQMAHAQLLRRCHWFIVSRSAERLQPMDGEYTPALSESWRWKCVVTAQFSMQLTTLRVADERCKLLQTSSNPAVTLGALL
jgi:hypothetical protein